MDMALFHNLNKEKKSKSYRKTINPSEDTFFEGTMCRIQLHDILAIMISFVLKIKITDVINHLRS